MLKLLFLSLFAASCGYQILATVLTAWFRRRQARTTTTPPRFCQIKPVRDTEARTLNCIETFLTDFHRYPHDFYICSAAEAPRDWLDRRPQITWLRIQADQSRNGKAATLAEARRYWSSDIFVISDADMLCGPGYLDAVLGEFADPKTGVVTCLYGAASAGGPGALLESLCILDFAASVLVAERTEGVTFAMGSTMAVRRQTLDDIGGFETLADYLADDFQLGYRAAQNGWKVSLAPTVLQTDVGRPTFLQALSHQYRWLVTSRVSRPAGHLAFVVTQGLLWSLLLAVVEPALGLRLTFLWSTLRCALGTIQRRNLSFPGDTLETLFLPLKDVLYLGLWTASLVGGKVRWGDRLIEIDPEGRIRPDTTA